MNARITRERQYHDAEAAARAITFSLQPSRLRFNDGEYLDHAPWVRPAVVALGELTGRRLLDFGCGHGMASVVFARRGAHVTATDLSPGYVAEAGRRAMANESEVAMAVADGHELPFAAGSFDLIWGHAILHHLDVPVAARELRRVLVPGGRVVLCDPWDGNPLVRWLRRGRRHTADEHALRPADIDALKGVFKKVTATTHQWGRYVVTVAE
ncbi:MAG: class I SAM-dependent methyltransferase [Gemmataceae bacterium]|nr:class I SAM-dependent methyltransferase [Gemmataceae bacterium]